VTHPSFAEPAVWQAFAASYELGPKAQGFSHLPRDLEETASWFSGTLPRNVRRVQILRYSRMLSPNIRVRWTVESAPARGPAPSQGG